MATNVALNRFRVTPRCGFQRLGLYWSCYLCAFGELNQATHICVGNLTIIGSDNGLSPPWILLTGPLVRNLTEILIAILIFSFKKMRLKVSPAKWRPCCLGLNVKSLRSSILEASFVFRMLIHVNSDETSLKLGLHPSVHAYEVPRHPKINIISFGNKPLYSKLDAQTDTTSRHADCGIVPITHWYQDEIAAILQTKFWTQFHFTETTLYLYLNSTEACA